MSVRLRTMAAVVLVAAMAVGLGARPAAAHAILLRTDPAPQTTVATPPSSVHLFFSEPVDVAFGAVRVFDVDGKRVDRGHIRLSNGRRQVVVDVPGAKRGTFTVTWRAVSADGHPVHGGFSFYVVSPSSISSVAIAGDASAGQTVGWAFGVVRFLWFAALFALIGVLAVRRLVWTPAVSQAGLAESEAATRFRRGAARLLIGAWVTLVLAGALAIVFEAATVSGLSLWSSARPDVIGQVLQTTYGRWWSVQEAISLAIGLPVWALTRVRRTLGLSPRVWIAFLATALGSLAVVTALNGHARTLGQAAIGVPALATHIVAAGVWVGGLAVLVVVAGPAWWSLEPGQRTTLLRSVLPRFSRLAMVGLVAVLATGTVNAVLGLAAVSDLWRVEYGRIVLLKIMLLVVAGIFGARHLLLITPRLAGAEEARATRSFRLTSAGELVVLSLAVALASGLMVLIPGRSLALAAKGPVNQERRAGPYLLQLFLDPSGPGANQLHVTFSDSHGLGAAEVTAATAVIVGNHEASRSPILRLISAGHFVGDVNLAAGRYAAMVTTNVAGSRTATTFRFRIYAKG